MTSKASATHYSFDYQGVRVDPYRIFKIYQITDPCQQHALKKLLRAGKSVKSLATDIDEVILTLQRWKAMLAEDLEVLPSERSRPPRYTLPADPGVPGYVGTIGECSSPEDVRRFFAQPTTTHTGQRGFAPGNYVVGPEIYESEYYGHFVPTTQETGEAAQRKDFTARCIDEHDTVTATFDKVCGTYKLSRPLKEKEAGHY